MPVDDAMEHLFGSALNNDADRLKEGLHLLRRIEVDRMPGDAPHLLFELKLCYASDSARSF